MYICLHRYIWTRSPTCGPWKETSTPIFSASFLHAASESSPATGNRVGPCPRNTKRGERGEPDRPYHSSAIPTELLILLTLYRHEWGKHHSLFSQVRVGTIKCRGRMECAASRPTVDECVGRLQVTICRQARSFANGCRETQWGSKRDAVARGRTGGRV